MVLDLCDEIILLNNGKIVSSGNPCEILANQELLEANGLEFATTISAVDDESKRNIRNGREP
ncbi:MAG: hypothetical protein V8R63_02610 [Thomasclavelia ramosa]